MLVLQDLFDVEIDCKIMYAECIKTSFFHGLKLGLREELATLEIIILIQLLTHRNSCSLNYFSN